MKNARDCHAHGDGDSNVPAARRNRAASRSVSRYGVGRGGSGLPLVGEHVRVGIVGQSHPPAEVPDVREPRAATPGIRVDPMGDPSLHDAPLQTHGPVFEAMPVERAQDPDAGGAMPAHGRLEADVLLQFAGERADESVFRGSHDDPPSGTGSTHASIPPRCVAM